MRLAYLACLLSVFTIFCVMAPGSWAAEKNLVHSEAKKLTDQLIQWILSAVDGDVIKQHEDEFILLRNKLFDECYQLSQKIIDNAWKVTVNNTPADGFQSSIQVDDERRTISISLADSVKNVWGTKDGELILRIISVMHELHNATKAEQIRSIDQRVKSKSLDEMEYVRTLLGIEWQANRESAGIVANLANETRPFDEWGTERFLAREKVLNNTSQKDIMNELLKSEHAEHYRKCYKNISRGASVSHGGVGNTNK